MKSPSRLDYPFTYPSHRWTARMLRKARDGKVFAAFCKSEGIKRKLAFVLGQD